MNRSDVCVLTLTILLVAWMAALTFTSPYPNGTDVWFHILVARAWYKGLNGMVSPVVMDINNIPYPPLFHLLLIPFAGSLEASLLAAKVLQLVFYPLSVLAWGLLIRKYMGSQLALTFMLAITGTYFSFSQMQSKPESLALLLLPVILWAFLENKTLPFVAVSVALFYIYSPYSLVLIAGILLYLLRFDLKSTKVWATAALSAPIALYQASFINELFISRWISQGDKGIIRETWQFIYNPILFILNGFGVNVISFTLIPYTFWKWKQQTALTKTMLLTFLSMLVVWPIWFQRTFSLIIIPCCYITALYMQRQQNRLTRAALLIILVVQAIIFTLNPVWWMSPISWLNTYW